jgi:hypothetical protein
MKEVIYDHTTLNINLCNIIDLYSIMKPRYYSKELLKKTRDLLCMLNYKCNYFHIKWNKYHNEWICKIW